MSAIGTWSAIFFAVGALASTAWGDGIPEQIIQNQHKNCVEACTEKAPGHQPTCEKACTCIDIATQKFFSASEFAEYERQISVNPDAPTFTPEIKAKVVDMFSACGIRWTG